MVETKTVVTIVIGAVIVLMGEQISVSVVRLITVRVVVVVEPVSNSVVVVVGPRSVIVLVSVAVTGGRVTKVVRDITSVHVTERVVEVVKRISLVTVIGRGVTYIVTEMY